MVLVLFLIAWSAIAFAIVRAVTIVFVADRRIAVATGLAVALAFLLGAISPFALPSRVTPLSVASPAVQPGSVAAVSTAASSSRSVMCPAGAAIVAKTASGHLDTLAVGSNAPAGMATMVSVPNGQTLQLGGWIVEDSGPATAICAIVDGHVAAAVTSYGATRPDVATALQKATDAQSGFVVTLKLPRGSHTVTVGAVASDGHSINPMFGDPLKADVR